jgi:hypothetical protein
MCLGLLQVTALALQFAEAKAKEQDARAALAQACSPILLRALAIVTCVLACNLQARSMLEARAQQIHEQRQQHQLDLVRQQAVWAEEKTHLMVNNMCLCIFS